MVVDKNNRADLLKLYELVLVSEDRYLNRAETRSRFYQVTVSALIGVGTVVMLQVIADTQKYGPIELLFAGFAIQAVGILASFVSIWSLPAIFRVYRRSVWEAAKRYKLEMLLGLADGMKSVPAWPAGLEQIDEKDHYLTGRQNLSKDKDPAKWLHAEYIDARATRGVYRLNSYVFYVLAVLGMIIAGSTTTLDIKLAISFAVEVVAILGFWIWTIVFVKRIR